MQGIMFLRMRLAVNDKRVGGVKNNAENAENNAVISDSVAFVSGCAAKILFYS